MEEDLKEAWLEAKFSEAARLIASNKQAGADLGYEELTRKISELYSMITRIEIDHDLDLNYLVRYLMEWLMEEKKMTEDLATELCLPLNKLILETGLKKLDKKLNHELNGPEHKAKIIPFRGGIK